jgi:hypothetical protein
VFRCSTTSERKQLSPRDKECLKAANLLSAKMKESSAAEIMLFFWVAFFSNHFFERVFSREEFFLEDMGLSPQNKSLLTKSDHAEHENIIVNMIFVQISDKNAILKSTNFSRLSGRLTVKKKEKT